MLLNQHEASREDRGEETERKRKRKTEEEKKNSRGKKSWSLFSSLLLPFTSSPVSSSSSETTHSLPSSCISLILLLKSTWNKCKWGFFLTSNDSCEKRIRNSSGKNTISLSLFSLSLFLSYNSYKKRILMSPLTLCFRLLWIFFLFTDIQVKREELLFPSQEKQTLLFIPFSSGKTNMQYVFIKT